MSKKFNGPKCPTCHKAQKASSQTQWSQGNYACGCNSWDYQLVKDTKKEIAESAAKPLSLDEEITFLIPGPPGILKNGKEIVYINGRAKLVPSVNFIVWVSKALKHMGEQWYGKHRPTISGPITLQVHFYRQTHRKMDLSNLYQGIEDSLQLLNIIIDDDQIESHDGSRKFVDKNNPRTEVTIKPFTL